MSCGACVPCSVVRPSAAYDRGPVVLRPRVDRRESASGLGSHVPWRDVASWAGRSASSGLSGILSCRPRGDLVSTPRGTQTRRAPDSARRVFVGRMIRPASKGCQTSCGRGSGAPTRPEERGPSGVCVYEVPFADERLVDLSPDRRSGRFRPRTALVHPGCASVRNAARIPAALLVATTILPSLTPSTDTPGGYSGNALQPRRTRCYPLRTFGAGNAGGALRGPSENPPTNARHPVHDGLSEDARGPTPVVQ